MNSVVSLNIPQIIAVAWVWQTEIEPIYTSVWQKLGVKCGMYRKPGLHIAAYNRLLDQLCSGTPLENIEYTKGALSMLADNAARVLNAFSSPISTDGCADENFVYCANYINAIVSGRVTARKQIKAPSAESCSEARKIIRQLLAVDEKGVSPIQTIEISLASSF